MENTNRISILLSEKLNNILSELSELTGQPKTAIIQTAIIENSSDYLDLIATLRKYNKPKKKH